MVHLRRLSSGSPWNTDDLRLLRALYPTTPRPVLLQTFGGRTWISLKLQASINGLRRTRQDPRPPMPEQRKQRIAIKERETKSGSAEQPHYDCNECGKRVVVKSRRHLRMYCDDCRAKATGRRIAQSKLGKPRPDIRGPLNWRWKGGISPETNKRLSRLEWKIQRRKALARDGSSCRRCGATGNLDVHHRIPYRISRDDSLENLITLCDSCHSQVENWVVAIEV